MTTTPTIPAERIVEGTGFQKVNLYKDGAYSRQVRFYGTEAQARAAAELTITKHVNEDETPNARYAELIRIIRGF